MKNNVFIIGTRASPLALAQADLTSTALTQAFGLDKSQILYNIIRTSGDMIVDRALSEAGGKGLFTKEIDEAQLRGEISIAVHSAKDLPTRLPEGLAVAGYLPRADVRDAFISNSIKFRDLPMGSRIGTASLRRRAQLLHLRPDLTVDLIRGTVETRLKKVKSGDYTGTLLALAGLERLDLAHEATEILDVQNFLPAVAQGAIALVIKADNEDAFNLVAQINHPPTQQAVEAERSFLHELNGSCRTPIAGYAQIFGDYLHLKVSVMSPNGQTAFNETVQGSISSSLEMCSQLGENIRSRLPDNFFTLEV